MERVRLLMDLLTDLPPQPAEYYRRKATQTRQVAEGVTTRAVKSRLLEGGYQGHLHVGPLP
jgi:hypothetical protein